MRKGFALLAVLLMVATGSALAAGDGKSPFLFHQATRGDMSSDLAARPSFDRPASDTIYFGGCDPATGFAREGYIWDWDTDIATCPFQGWTSTDKTDNPGIYFARVVSTDFTDHGDGCVPMILGTEGQLWVGIHEDEADLRDFTSGMGYQNNMCQNAFSPEFAIDATADAVTIGFIYFNDTEPAFDYTFVDLLCFDGGGGLIEEHRVEIIDGIIGDYLNPATYTNTVVAGELDEATETVQLRLQMYADGGWSDEDGDWATECGPFGCDNMTLTVGSASDFYDWDIDAEGWTFDKCPGIGLYMGLCGPGHLQNWEEWLEFAGVLCECDISGNAIESVDEEGSPYWPPGHINGQEEVLMSNVIARAGTPYQPPDYNATIARWHQYVYLRYGASVFYRAGYSFYPYVSESNPNVHWSPRMGQDTWYYTGETPDCYLSGCSYTSPPDGNPLPAAWDSLRACHEISCRCDGCPLPGDTWGSPVLDNYKVGITGAVDAPSITLDTGHLFHDGFGQNFPYYLEPCDVGNSNITRDLGMDDETDNDWNGDTACVVGPTVVDTIPESYWACDLCLKITQKGPCQDRIPGFAEWKARFDGDVETDWVCARMDSFENFQGAWPHKYTTHFHEDAYGFDPGYADLTQEQEIAPDGIFTPGTALEYKYRGWWWNDGAPPTGYLEKGPYEYVMLPGMRTTGGGPQGYDWEYPCVLYVDAYNRGSEYYITPLLDQMGLEFDKWDSLDPSSNWDTAMKRSYGGTTYNPGGWGNNGCTQSQLLGYRLIMVNTGAFGVGAWKHNDSGGGTGIIGPNFELLEGWLESNECGLEARRRALIMNGDGMTAIMDDQHADFLNNTLGVTLESDSYRDFNNDWEFCVYLEPTPEAVFEPVFPYVSVYGNGCPNIYDYNVLGVQPGVCGAVGNLKYYSYLGTGDQTYVDYAQVVRYDAPECTSEDWQWRSVVDGFSFHHLSERGCNGEDCSSDSVCVIDGAADLMGPELEWLEDPLDPYDPWRYPCVDTGVEEDGESHLTGPVNYLFKSRPNPFTSRVDIRFTLASEGHVNLSIFDVSGRLVKTLLDGKKEAGETALVWDGTSNAGHRVDTGIFWMKMKTRSGYESGSKMILLK